METLINSITTWSPIDPSTRLQQLRSEAGRHRRPARLALGSLISSFDLYAYLKARFGPPNGIQMISRAQSSDNLFHWHYTLAAGPATLDIWQGNLTAEIIVEGTNPPTDADWQQLLLAIKNDFKVHGPKMSKVKNELERWNLFVNPYKRLRDVLEQCRNDLNALGIDVARVPETPSTPEELQAFVTTIDREAKRFQ
jgi:hypothetical protein